MYPETVEMSSQTRIKKQIVDDTFEKKLINARLDLTEQENILKFPYVPNKNQFIKSPLNYIGGKYKILNQIIPLFPHNIDCFIDLFAGGGNVGVNINAKKIVLNDNLTYLIDMYSVFQDKSLEEILGYIHKQIIKFNLSKENEFGYKQLRLHYNSSKNPLDLLVLVAFSFNHQIRFNNSHEFNNPFGKNRSSYNQNIENNLIEFVGAFKQKNIKLTSNSFEEVGFENLGENDLVYCDPPYLITTGTYNDGKRGFKGWSAVEERTLLKTLDSLNSNGIKFALSNVVEHKGKSNDILKSWLQNNKTYKINYINKHYANSNYQTIDKNKNSSIEVLITNYVPVIVNKNSQLALFGN